MERYGPRVPRVCGSRGLWTGPGGPRAGLRRRLRPFKASRRCASAASVQDGGGERGSHASARRSRGRGLGRASHASARLSAQKTRRKRERGLQHQQARIQRGPGGLRLPPCRAGPRGARAAERKARGTTATAPSSSRVRPRTTGRRAPASLPPAGSVVGEARPLLAPPGPPPPHRELQHPAPLAGRPSPSPQHYGPHPSHCTQGRRHPSRPGTQPRSRCAHPPPHPTSAARRLNLTQDWGHSTRPDSLPRPGTTAPPRWLTRPNSPQAQHLPRPGTTVPAPVAGAPARCCTRPNLPGRRCTDSTPALRFPAPISAPPPLRYRTRPNLLRTPVAPPPRCRIPVLSPPRRERAQISPEESQGPNS